MRRAPAVFVAILAALPALAGEGDPPIKPARLKRDLEQGAKLFRQKPDNSAARAIAEHLSYADVQWNDGTITVRDPWLDDAVDSLERLPPDVRKRQIDAIADHLTARAQSVDTLVEAAAVASPSPGATPAPEPEAILEGILEEKRFSQPPEDPKLAQAAARFRDGIRSAWSSFKQFIADLFQPRQQGGALDTIRQFAILGLAALTVVGIAWLAIRLLFRAAVDTAADEPETEMPEAPPQPAEMAAEAKARISSGDHRSAIRALYLALVGKLHQQGAIVYDRHRTNREYLRGMRAAPDRRAAFEEIVEVFDRKWYGKEPCSLAEVEAFEAATIRAGDPSMERRTAA